MPTKNIRGFKANTPNIEVMNAIRNSASNAYQQRVPEATKANLQDNIRHLLEYHPDRNEFIDALVNRIGSVIARNVSWTNPLARFKQGMLQYGDTIEEVQLGLIKARTYDARRDYLEKDIFGQYENEAQSSFHTITRQEYYPLSVNDIMLRRAFLDDTGVSSMITQLMEQPTTSDNWDEFLQTTALFSEFDKLNGFYKVQVNDVTGRDSTSDEAKALLRQIRAYADKLTFISRDFNAAGMPVHAQKDELVLFLSPEANAALDVEALAAAFNIERSDVNMLTIVLPQENFGIDGLQAILTTSDFFVMADTFLENRNAPNPVALSTNYFLHHHEVISASRFAPAIVFTTQLGDSITVTPTPVVSVTDIVVTKPDGTVIAGTTGGSVARGSYYDVDADAVTDPAGGPNDGVRFELSGHKSGLTFLSQSGTLNVPIEETADELVIKAIATGVDADADEVSKTRTLKLTGDAFSPWPNPAITSETPPEEPATQQ